MNMFRREGLGTNLNQGRETLLRTMWRQSYPGLAAMGVFSVVFNILRLSTAIYALQVLDRVVSSRSIETLVMLTVIVLIAVLAATLLGIIRRVMFLNWGGWIERQLGPHMFEIGIAQSSDTRSPSSLLRDVGTLRSFVAGPGLVSWIDVCFAPLFFAVVFLISPQMGLIVLIAAGLILILGIWNELATRKSRSAAYSAGADDGGLVTAVERNRETVGSLSMGTNFAEMWYRSATERLDESDRTRKINIYFRGAMVFVRRCLRIAVLAFGIWLVIEGSMTIGAVIASYYVGRTGFSLVQVAMERWRDMINARRSYKRIQAALKQHETVQVSMGRNTLPVPLVYDNVSYRYPRQGNALFRNINLTVSPGEALYVIGPSAVGKTTVCAADGRRDEADDGADQRRDREARRRQRPSSCPERPGELCRLPAPAHSAVQRDDPREHRPHVVWRYGSRHRGGQAGRDPRCDHPAAARLRYGDLGRRAPAVRRPTEMRRPCPRVLWLALVDRS